MESWNLNFGHFDSKVLALHVSPGRLNPDLGHVHLQAVCGGAVSASLKSRLLKNPVSVREKMLEPQNYLLLFRKSGFPVVLLGGGGG